MMDFASLNRVARFRIWNLLGITACAGLLILLGKSLPPVEEPVEVSPREAQLESELAEAWELIQELRSTLSALSGEPGLQEL